jgi:CheY-like chemotaxis protein
MPEMDGLEAIRQIRTHEQGAGLRRTPIVVVSANTSAEDVRDCVEAGADGHIAKPVARMDVLGAVSEFLSKRD